MRSRIIGNGRRKDVGCIDVENLDRFDLNRFVREVTR